MLVRCQFHLFLLLQAGQWNMNYYKNRYNIRLHINVYMYHTFSCCRIQFVHMSDQLPRRRRSRDESASDCSNQRGRKVGKRRLRCTTVSIWKYLTITSFRISMKVLYFGWFGDSFFFCSCASCCHMKPVPPGSSRSVTSLPASQPVSGHRQQIRSQITKNTPWTSLKKTMIKYQNERRSKW